MSGDAFDYAASTALVTGGSSGIGRAIAAELMRRGVGSLLLVARNRATLDRAGSELAGAGPTTRIETFAIDLADPGAASRLAAEVRRLDWEIDLLVNDAGVGSSGPFAGEHQGKDSLAIVDVNVRAVVALSEQFMPGMVERGHGGVLNVGSTAGLGAVPFSAVYAASKAFIISFSRALWLENRSTGVRVVCVTPGVTRTNLAGPGKGEVRGGLEKVIHSEPDEVATVALDLLDADKPTRIVGTANRALQLGLALVPAVILGRLIARLKK